MKILFLFKLPFFPLLVLFPLYVPLRELDPQRFLIRMEWNSHADTDTRTGLATSTILDTLPRTESTALLHRRRPSPSSKRLSQIRSSAVFTFLRHQCSGFEVLTLIGVPEFGLTIFFGVPELRSFLLADLFPSTSLPCFKNGVHKGILAKKRICT